MKRICELLTRKLPNGTLPVVIQSGIEITRWVHLVCRIIWQIYLINERVKYKPTQIGL